MAARSGAAIRVLHVLEALESGCARHLVDVTTHATGVEHHVVLPRARVGGVTDERAAGLIGAAGGTVHVVEMRRRPVDHRNAGALVELRRLVRRLRPDVLHGHSSIGGVLARTVGAGSGVATAYTPNALAAGATATGVERVLGRRTNRLVAVSASERDEVLRRRIMAEARISVIPNGITTDPPPPADLHALVGVEPGTPLVGTVGRLAPQKAPEVFVAACAVVAITRPDVHFVHLGDGALAGQVDAAVAAAGLGARFHRLGAVPDAARYLPGLAVFVLTSRYEGGPYAPLEAMRAMVPVVLSDVVGSRDCVEPGRTGLLVPPGDPGATAAAVLDVLDHPSAAASRAAAAGADLRDRFDVVGMGVAHRELYRALATEGPVGARRPGAARRTSGIPGAPAV